MRPELLPDGHGRLAARPARVLAGNGHLDPLRVEDLGCMRPANDDRTGLGVGLMILAPLLGAIICLVIIGFLLGKAA